MTALCISDCTENITLQNILLLIPEGTAVAKQAHPVWPLNMTGTSEMAAIMEPMTTQPKLQKALHPPS